VSTFALAYNYSKRAQIIMRVDKQSPLQVSDGVIDSRPALELKSWAEDEWERGRAAEIEAFGLAVPAERLDMEFPTATLPPDLAKVQGKRRDAADEAVYSYDRAVRLAADANAEYARHMADPKYFDRAATYRSHVASLEAMAKLAAADRDYLKAALLPAGDPQREKLLADSLREYQDAIGAYQLVILRFFVTEEFAKEHFGENLTRATVVDQPRAVQDRVMQRVREALAKSPPLGSEDDVSEYERYIARSEARMGQAMRK